MMIYQQKMILLKNVDKKRINASFDNNKNENEKISKKRKKMNVLKVFLNQK